jgi:hypothetical protein
VPEIEPFLKLREGKALVNYGASASHPWARVAAWGGALPSATGQEILPAAGPATDESASEERVRAMQARLRGELAKGALGIGVGINYTPGASRLEMIDIFRVAAERATPLWPHIRAAGYSEPGSSIESVGEVIAAAAVTGAPLHIVHINSMGLGQVFECMKMIEGARARGLDVTTEAYPYGWGMTMLNSALFNPGWRERMRIDYSDLRLGGDRRAALEGELRSAARRERQGQRARARQSRRARGRGHPSSARDDRERRLRERRQGPPAHRGTYSRILKRYVREQRSVTLMDAIRKMS